MGWILLAVVVLAVAVVSLSFATTAPARASGFDPESAGFSGTRALAEIVRDAGVEVVVVRNRAAAVQHLDDRSTLVLADPYPLSDEAALELVGSAERTVLLTASSRMLRLLDLGENASGTSDPVGPSCDEAGFARVGTIVPDRMFRAADDVTTCFGDGDAAAVLVADREGSRVTLVDGSRLLTNEHLAEHGNAALGMALLGQSERVVWYVPSFSDSDISDADAEATLGELTPGWVSPVIVLLLLTAVVAGIWRGRRFGPLVAETLPVTVRASETMQGRARLTARGGDARHAAAELRTGTLARLAARLSMPESAGVAAIADATADRIRTSRDSVRAVLEAPLPTSDAELVADARRLAALETAVDDIARTERSTP
nr:DUF4350 domain-containing protein [Microbacterium pseudoresistens]